MTIFFYNPTENTTNIIAKGIEDRFSSSSQKYHIAIISVLYFISRPLQVLLVFVASVTVIMEVMNGALSDRFKSFWTRRRITDS